jgi:hypothetical protein
MPIATDSGYLPDWLKALLGQGGMAPNAPAGLFADTAASPSPAVGLLSNLPQFTGVQPSAPAFQGDNAPNGPLPDQPATFSYLNPRPPWGGSGPSNSYPSMLSPQDPGPMNIGPSGAAPTFSGVRPDAPFMANGPTTVQDQYANVPLPPRRPNDLTSFQAMAPGAPQDINTPPAGQPNSNVVGTQASGAPEITAQKSQGIGDYLGKAANLIGGIYGAGGPGDALIALGLSNRTNGASIQALNAGILNRSKQSELALKQAEANDKIKAIAGNVSLVKKLYPNMGDAEASAFARNPEMMKQIGQVAAPMEQWSPPYTDEQGNTAMRHLRTGETKILQSANETFHPATPQEKAAAGINPNDPTPYQTSDRTQKIAPIGGPATAVTVNNAPALSYGGELLAPVVEEHKKLVAGLPQSQERLRNLNAMSGALQAIREKGGTTGMGEEEKTRLQSFVNTAANAVGMQPFDISDKELMNKFGRLMAANAAKDAQGARVTNFELDNFLKANPGLSLSPQGNERLLGIMQQIEERNINVSKELRKRATAKNPPSVQENDQWVQQYDEEHHIKDPITGQDITADPRLPDTGASAAPTASSSGKKIRTYNPKTGLLE